MRAPPHSGPSAHTGAPAAVHLVSLGAVTVLCATLDVAGHGLAAGAALLTVAVMGAGLLRYGLARPLVELRQSVVRTTRDPASSLLPHSRLADLARLRHAVLVLQGRALVMSVTTMITPCARSAGSGAILLNPA